MLNSSQMRQELHSIAELSGEEKNTQSQLKNWLNSFGIKQFIDFDDTTGFCAVYDSGKPGSTIAFRTDTDALPIKERNVFSYRSKQEGVSHKCGHDGHMATMLELAKRLSESPLEKGRVVFIFQAEEEIGAGAKKMYQAPQFLELKIDEVYGYHNLPGEELSKVILIEPIFACASAGLKFVFQGTSSHAGEPEKAQSPLPLMETLKDEVQSLNTPLETKDFFQATLVYMKLGEENYGITPGDGEMSFTIRSSTQQHFDQKKSEILELANSEASRSGLKLKTQIIDEFPSLEVDPQAVKIVEDNAKKAGLDVERRKHPFRWSEDFGYFTRQTKGTFLGLGLGENTKPLHDPEYDFNDKLLKPAADLFESIARSRT